MKENNMTSQTKNTAAKKHSGLSIKKLYSRAVRALRRSNHDDALSLTQEIIARQSDHAGAHAVQFSSLFKSKKFESARQMGNQAAELNPKSVFILNNQACLELECKNPTPATNLLSSLIEQYGERAQWLYNLALSHALIGQYSKAISMFKRTLDQDPKHDKAARKLAATLEQVGHYEEASQAYAYWRLLQPESADAHARYIHCSTISGNISSDDLTQELSLWQDKFIPKGKRYDVADIQNKKTLNIGFIYASLPNEWTEKIVKPLANELANNGDQITFYCHNHLLQFNDNIKSINATNVSDANFARRVRADEIDVLIDLCGMRKGNRQRALGLQLASKQFAWLGHEGVFATPLLESLDDKLNQSSSPFYFQAQNAENKKAWPEKTFAGIAASNGLSFSVIKTWAKILNLCPDWQLHIQTNKNTPVEKLLSQRFSAAGVDRSKIRFDTDLGYDKTTIVLDNFSNNDPASLSDGILLGATPIALKGNLFPAQQNTQLLKQLGLSKNVLNTEFEFIEHAVMLAQKGVKKSPLRGIKKHRQNLSDLSSFAKTVRKIIVD